MRVSCTGWIGVLGLFGIGASISCRAADRAPSPRVELRECRLQHPLEISSLEARCATLSVPLDRAQPQAGSIGLKVAVIPALDRGARNPPLFLIAGGPGQGTIAMYLTLAPAFARVQREHDIVLVDQRGTGGSSPVNCDYPDDWRGPVGDLSKLREITVSCLARHGESVRFYTSSAAVADLDDVRQALGYAAIDLYGASYGTRVAQLYMRRHPDSTAAVILDGVTAPQEAIGPDTPLYAERALDAIIARCAADSDCARAYPKLGDELLGLRNAFGPRKLPLTIDDPSSGLPLEIEFNREILNASLRFLSYSATEASLLPTLIHRASQGAFAPLAAQAVTIARQVADQLASGMQNTVICSEDVPFYAGAMPERLALEATYQRTDQLDAFEEICKIWPRGLVDADLHAPLVSSIPTLLLSGESDPVTPPADAERAALGLAHKRHLVLPGEGHGQLATACVPLLMASFLNGTAPEKLDASCLERHRPTPFFVNTNGPAP